MSRNPIFSSRDVPLNGRQDVQEPPHRFTLQRVYPALIFAPLFYVVVRYFPPAAFFTLIAIVSTLAFHEFIKITLPASPSAGALGLSTGSVILLLGLTQWTNVSLIVIAIASVVVALLLIFMFIPQSVKAFLRDSRAYPFGVCYIGGCLGHLLLIRNLESGDLLIFFILLVTWAADTGGYYIGASMGRRPIAPRLSPKKTIEGFLGGMVFSVVIASVSHFWFLPWLPLLDCIILGIVLTIVGLLGDLSESTFKRHAGVKDSGSMIPGHGGILDRIDSVLLTAPAFYYYMILIGIADGV